MKNLIEIENFDNISEEGKRKLEKMKQNREKRLNQLFEDYHNGKLDKYVTRK